MATPVKKTMGGSGILGWLFGEEEKDLGPSGEVYEYKNPDQKIGVYMPGAGLGRALATEAAGPLSSHIGKKAVESPAPRGPKVMRREEVGNFLDEMISREKDFGGAGTPNYKNDPVARAAEESLAKHRRMLAESYKESAEREAQAKLAGPKTEEVSEFIKARRASRAEKYKARAEAGEMGWQKRAKQKDPSFDPVEYATKNKDFIDWSKVPPDKRIEAVQADTQKSVEPWLREQGPHKVGSVAEKPSRLGQEGDKRVQGWLNVHEGPLTPEEYFGSKDLFKIRREQIRALEDEAERMRVSHGVNPAVKAYRDGLVGKSYKAR